jgi:phosphate transport system permease protein
VTRTRPDEHSDWIGPALAKRVRRPKEFAAVLILRLFAAVSVLTTLGIVWVLASESVGFFRHVSIRDFLTDTQWTPLFSEKHFGILPLLTGTLLVTVIACALAVPLGVLAAIGLYEFLPNRIARKAKPALEILAGIPTVVYGYFALLFVTPLIQKVIPRTAVFNALSAGIVMGMMILPMIASLSEDALSLVPKSVIDGAYALGATRSEVIFRIAIPGALSGIVASVILAVSRAIGETMIVAIAMGQQPRLTLDPLIPSETMSAYIVQVSLGDTPRGSIEYQTIFAVGGALFVVTMLLNLASRRFSRRFREVYE